METWKSITAVCVAALVLTGMYVEQRSWPQPLDAQPYHQAIAEQMTNWSPHVGDWRSQEAEIPPAAIQMLRPNEYISRHYHRPGTGKGFSFLLIHCGDANDMLGHYPPRCYPSQGWESLDAEPKTWQLDDEAVEGMEYSFYQTLDGATQRLTVVNLIILPNGNYGHGMDDVRRVLGDRRFRNFGAAQVQFVFGSRFSESDRREVVKEFINATRPIIDEIRFGIAS